MNIYFNTPCSLELENEIKNILNNANLFNGKVAGETIKNIRELGLQAKITFFGDETVITITT